jgi:hypothetical protein
LIKNFLNFRVSLDPDSFGPGYWSRKFSGFKVDAKLKNDITALSGCIDRVLKMVLILDITERLEKCRKF